MLDGHEVRFEKSSHVHFTCILCENFGVVEETLRHARWMWDLKSHLACISHEKYLNRCYLFDVPRPNDEYLQDFPLYTFQMSSCVVTRWHLKGHLASTSHENFGVLGHARWTQGEIWKVISHIPHMRTLLLDVTSLMFQGQMMKICKIFSLYTFQMSSHVDARWHLKNQLVVHLVWELWCTWSC